MLNVNDFGRRSKDRFGAGCTPFRYPGGKAFLTDFLEEQIVAAEGVTAYAEPYAGGAGAAIELLARGTVDRIVLNDFDNRVHAAWWAMLHQTNEFIDLVLSTPVNMDSWRRCQQLVVDNDRSGDKLALGFATYFLNRTNHSGVILGAGPIGGHSQTGKWLIDARYYAETMVRRIRWLGDRKEDIALSNEDGLAFLKKFPAAYRDSTFFFIDPPYVQAGAKLYLNAMSDLKHQDLAAYLTATGNLKNWLVTYDDCQLIHDAYSTAQVDKLAVRYSLRTKRTEHEVCVMPSQAALLT
ncbi:MAG: DNA methyltransferase [Sphingomonas taxi]|uniref:DNA methyltransferase n=1 Tax=Sphingomonas taxi TaxID=1549858 RepID=A0A2W4YXT3_9SPHN|nr:MAG: DNA methyltransferase [Sphingomonas taxi]